MICWSWQLAPHPIREASVKKKRLGSGVWSGTPCSTSALQNHWRCEIYSWFSWIWLSHGWACCSQPCFIQNRRKCIWSHLWWMKGAKCETAVDRSDLMSRHDVDRRDRMLVSVSRNELGGDIRAYSRLKWRPRNFITCEGARRDFFQFIVHPNNCRRCMVSWACTEQSSGLSALMIQWWRLAWTLIPLVINNWTTGANVLVNSPGTVDSPNSSIRYW